MQSQNMFKLCLGQDESWGPPSFKVGAMPPPPPPPPFLLLQRLKLIILQSQTFFSDEHCLFNSHNSVVDHTQILSIALCHWDNTSVQCDVVSSHGNCDPTLNPGSVVEWRVTLLGRAGQDGTLEVSDDGTRGMNFHLWRICVKINNE